MVSQHVISALSLISAGIAASMYNRIISITIFTLSVFTGETLTLVKPGIFSYDSLHSTNGWS